MSETALKTGGRSGTSQGAFLSLPGELRQQIYLHLFAPAPTCTIHAGGHEDSTKITCVGLNSNVLFTCRSIYNEALPVLCSRMTLHITYQANSPYQPDIKKHLPLHVRLYVQDVVYHIRYGVPSYWLPKAPFDFQLFPRLRRFVVQKPFLISLDTMVDSPGESGVENQAHSEWNRLSESDKTKIWARTGLLEGRTALGPLVRGGSGGWVSALLQPEVFGRVGGDPEGSGVPEGCQVVGETFIVLFTILSRAQDHTCETVEGMIVSVDAREQTTTDVRFLNKEQTDECLLKAGEQNRLF